VLFLHGWDVPDLEREIGDLAGSLGYCRPIPMVKWLQCGHRTVNRGLADTWTFGNRAGEQ
jgi:hypothetical protein